jgi:Rad3-related DNA helicase
VTRDCLVIMPFSRGYKEIFDHAIKPACDGTGFRCLRADYPIKAGSIIEHTIDLIFEADVVVADLSSLNANVFYELGVAHALEKQTVMICEEGTKLPFNVTTYRVVFYQHDIDGIEEVLRSTLEDILGNVENWASVRTTNPVQAIKLLRQLEERRQELEIQVKELEEERRRQPEVLEFILPDIELKHLRALGGRSAFRYKRLQPFLEELRHLRWAGLIRNLPGTTIGGIPDEGNLKDYLELTEKGERFLAHLVSRSETESARS